MHPQKDILTDNGEIICKGCGQLLGEDYPTLNIIHSKTNLLQDCQLGSKQTGSFLNEKYINPYSEISIISNICHALKLPQYISHDVLTWYKKIHHSIDLTRAKILLLVIYTLCRYNSIPLNENTVRKAIEMYLHVKNTPNSLKVISKSLSFLDKEDNIPVLEKIGFTALMDSTPNFILFSKLKTLEDDYSPIVIANIKKSCYEMLAHSDTTDPTSVKKIIRIVLARCGVC